MAQLIRDFMRQTVERLSIIPGSDQVAAGRQQLKRGDVLPMTWSNLLLLHGGMK